MRFYLFYIYFTVVLQLLSCVWLLTTPWTAAHQTSLSPIISQSLPKLMSIESAIRSNHLILCCPLLLLPSIFPSIRVFSNASALCLRWPNYWSFNFSISPSNGYSGLISFRVDWFDFFSNTIAWNPLIQTKNKRCSINRLYLVNVIHNFLLASFSFQGVDFCFSFYLFKEYK